MTRSSAANHESREIWAESVYRSEAIEADLQEQGYVSQLHERAYRNKPLTEEQKEQNRKKSSIRARVEHVFGHIEGAMHGCFVRTIGLSRAKAKIGLECLAYNISRLTCLMTSQARKAPA